MLLFKLLLQSCKFLFISLPFVICPPLCPPHWPPPGFNSNVRTCVYILNSLSMFYNILLVWCQLLKSISLLGKIRRNKEFYGRGLKGWRRGLVGLVKEIFSKLFFFRLIDLIFIGNGFNRLITESDSISWNNFIEETTPAGNPLYKILMG